MELTRRGFLSLVGRGALSVAAAPLLAPLAPVEEVARRFWALDRTMLAPRPLSPRAAYALEHLGLWGEWPRPLDEIEEARRLVDRLVEAIVSSEFTTGRKADRLHMGPASAHLLAVPLMTRAGPSLPGPVVTPDRFMGLPVYVDPHHPAGVVTIAGGGRPPYTIDGLGEDGD